MVPKTDVALAVYSTNFNARGSAAPADFNLTVEQMAQYSVVHEAFIAAFNAVRADGARSRALVEAKEQIKKSQLLPYARMLYKWIQASRNVSNENKTLIGVKIRPRKGSPIAPPALAPLVSVLSVTGRTVRYKLTDASAPAKRHRPVKASGAQVLTHAGATPPPVGEAGWKHMQTGQTMVTVTFDNSVEPGTPCWMVARWHNRRGQYSPASQPVVTYLQVGSARAAA